MIFPLPLAPFEEYMLLDDRSSHPMSFFLKLIFSGKSEPEGIDDALQSALRRHPLLSATVRETKKDRFFWFLSQPEEIVVSWVPRDEKLSASHIDLFSEPGLRVSARRQDRETELLFQFHHACCDGIGALRFIEDLLVAYAATDCGDNNGRDRRSVFRPIDDRCLLGRGRFGLTAWKLLKIAHRQARGLLGVRQFLMRRPVPLQPIETASVTAELPIDFPNTIAHQFSEAETTGLLTAARKAEKTVNDVLARDLFLAMSDFRSSRQLGNENEWLRLSIPMNLRSQEDVQLSASNVVSMVFLDRQSQDFANAETLLDSVNDEMQLIKTNQLGLTFPLSLQFSRPLPGAISRLRKLCGKPSCRGTAVLSNLGRPLQEVPLARCEGKIVSRGMLLERMEFLPPVRPQTVVAFGVFTYVDRLHVALQFDQRGLKKPEANELFRRFINRITETGGT